MGEILQAGRVRICDLGQKSTPTDLGLVARSGATVFSSSIMDGMLVDVIRLRVKGKRLPSTMLDGLPSVRGYLVVSSREEHTEAMILNTPRLDQHSRELVPPMIKVRLRAARDDSLMIVGFEIESRGRFNERFRQAWWLRVAR